MVTACGGIRKCGFEGVTISSQRDLGSKIGSIAPTQIVTILQFNNYCQIIQFIK